MIRFNFWKITLFGIGFLCLFSTRTEIVFAQEMEIVSKQGLKLNDKELNELIQKEKWQIAYDYLMQFKDGISNSPRYQNTLGQVAMKLQHYVLAEQAFEKVVLIEPDNAGAWMDLAIVNVLLGNQLIANNYFQYIESQFSPPQKIRELIQHYRVFNVKQEKKDTQWYGVLETNIGYDSNVNGGLLYDSLILTTPSGNEQWEVDPQYLPKSDQFSQVQLGGGLLKILEKNENILLSLVLKKKRYQNQGSFSVQDAAVSFAHSKESNEQKWVNSLHVSNTRLGVENLYSGVRMSTAWEKKISMCTLHSSIELERKLYIERANLDSKIVWLQVNKNCLFKVSQRELFLNFHIRKGRDFSYGNRVGGIGNKTEMQLQLEQEILPNTQLKLDYAFHRSVDSKGYSPLLENNAVREIRRNSMRIQVDWLIKPKLSVIAAYEDFSMKSNIKLFDQTGRVTYLGLRFKM